VTTSFNNLRVVAFESRRAEEMAKLIVHYGGVPLVAPSMREVPLDDNPHAFVFADRLFAGDLDVVILLTGVGTRTLTQAITTKHPRDRFIDALKTTTIVARGPKPVAALRELGLTPNLTVPEPNTWRDILATIDRELPINGKRLAVQEYGVPNPELVAGLRERGAEVMTVPVYQWALPADLTPLQNAIREIIAGHADIALFTSAQQIRNLFCVAKEWRVSVGRSDRSGACRDEERDHESKCGGHDPFLLKNSTIRRSPSSNSTRGSSPRKRFALAMSAWV
jgi:uroporphyrinogen-III synthase